MCVCVYVCIVCVCVCVCDAQDNEIMLGSTDLNPTVISETMSSVCVCVCVCVRGGRGGGVEQY